MIPSTQMQSKRPDASVQGAGGQAQGQDKGKEIAFFDSHAAANSYDVFEPESSARLIQSVVRLGAFAPGARVADLGCGSGVFTGLLRQHGCVCTGLDISPKLIELARRKYPGIEFLEGDVERLPFPDASFDGVLLGGIVHHLPNPSPCAAEVYRVLRPGGRFVAFDPNRMNPFMYLYRDRSSPFYSSGGRDGERAPGPRRTRRPRRSAPPDSRVQTDYQPTLRYRYIASSRMRWLLPVYNAVDSMLFAPNFMRAFRPFVLTIGEKP